MLTFSTDGRVADEQIRAIIFYLTVFGYIDGDFDPSEKEFIRDYIRRIIPQRVEATGLRRSDDEYFPVCEQFERRYFRMLDVIDSQVQDILNEAVAHGDDRKHFAADKLKVRCFEIFQSFDEVNQRDLIQTVDEFIQADGVLHPAELRFREELLGLLHRPTPAHVKVLPVQPEPVSSQRERLEPGVHLLPNEARPVQRPQVPLLEGLEHHYSANMEQLMQQASADYNLVRQALDLLSRQRSQGMGELTNRRTADELLSEEKPFLDGHVYGVPPLPGRRYELTVLGDLHGCYSCLKAALAQSNFLAKVEAFKADPANHPDPKLIFLGDYIDRGRFSFEGVLRAALQLFVTQPDHVYMLRGNHEYFLEKDGRIFAGVAPAEAFAIMSQYWPVEQFQAYRALFESLPVCLFFHDTFFVHAGIPRDETFNPRWKDLTTLNEPKVRFEMIWSDPSDADYIPDELQRSNTRFSFGKLQFRNFMHRIGAKTLIRGHEKVQSGLVETYNFDGLRLFTLFSCGGANNNDLPVQSAYRGVTPMALTIRWEDGHKTLTPWAIDYETFNSPAHNNFLRTSPQLPGLQ